MNKTNKWIVVIILLFVFFVLTWIIISYKYTERSYNQKQNEIQNDTDSIATYENKIFSDNNSIGAQIIPAVSSQELNALINSTEPIMIIDTRSKELFEKGHITSSYHIDSADISTIANQIVLITQDGNEDLIMSQYRSLSTSKKVYNLEGGINMWSNNGFHLISSNPVVDFSSQSKVQFIEPRDFDAIIKDTQKLANTVIIDTRRLGNFTDGHVSTALNIPLIELEYRYKEIPHGKSLLVYSANDELSFHAGLLLYELGFINVKTMRGGFEAWMKYGYEVIK